MATKKTSKTKAKAEAAAKAMPAKAGKARSATQGKKLSALDAAAKVLGETGKALNCKELIAAMAAAGYWGSPKGKTPPPPLFPPLPPALAPNRTNTPSNNTHR